MYWDITGVMSDIDTISVLKIVYKYVKVSTNTAKLVMISANYHDITRLLLVTIIVTAQYRLLSKKIS